MSKFILILTLLAGIGVAVWKFCPSCSPPKPPHLDLDEWWGPGTKGKSETSIKPFKIEFTPEMIKDLKDRLSSRRTLTPPLEGVGFEYGFNTRYLNTVLDHWKDKYQFTNRQNYLNKYPQYKTNIQGLDIHFIHVKPEVPKNTKVLPLLLLHGWPGSVREFYEVIPLLTKKRSGYDFVFEVIIPSLPGYGFSDAAVRPGLGVAKMAVIMKNLMQRIGIKQYYVQGGDWGAAITSAMATLFPNEVLGYHTNMAIANTPCTMLKTIVGSFFPSLIADEKIAARMYPLSAFFSRILEETGYFHIQSTKPDTVGVGLNDSPAGLAAYILEKFSMWTAHEYKQLPDGGITKKYTLDQLLDNLMLYWASGSITTSVRLYAEEMSSASRSLQLEKIPTPVPTWALQTKYEIMHQSPYILKSKYPNLIDTTVLDHGGHFAALEIPSELADDIFKAVKAFGEFHNRSEKKTEL